MKNTISLVLVLALGLATLSLAAEGIWTTKTPMPTARLGLATSTVNGKIYAIGGYAQAAYPGMRTVEEYDPATDSWTTKADMPTGRHWLSTSVVNGKIYAIGGSRYEYTGISVVEEYDPATDTWTQKADMPTARVGLATSVVDGMIYAIGGSKAKYTQPLRTVEAYDPLTDTWTTKADMHTGRYFPSTGVVDGKIYAIGGAGSTADVVFSTVEEYDPATDTWTTITNMPEPRFVGLATTVVNGKIYLFGGRNGYDILSTVEEYDPATNTWTRKSDMPRPRAGAASSTVNGRIYVFGGASVATVHPGVRTVYEYDPFPLVVDFNGDEIVDSADICMMLDYWGTDEPFFDIAPAPFGDGIVDVQDLILLSEYLFEQILPPGLVAYWKLDETEGNIAYDSVGEYDGTFNGEPLWQPEGGMVGGALQFDGIDDYVFTPSFSLATLYSEFSVFAWVQGGAPGQTIISQIRRTKDWLYADPSAGCLITELRHHAINDQPLLSQAVITDGQWHRVGLVWDGTYRTLYVDDVKVASDDQESVGVLYGGLNIGAGKNLEPGSFWSGLIDDVRIYNRAVIP